jgi:hypothetical protein
MSVATWSGRAVPPKIVENMWSAARPGSFQAEVGQGALNAVDILNLQSPSGAVGVAGKVGKSLLEPSAKKAQERAMMETRNAFIDYVNALSKSKSGAIPF